MVLDKLGDSLKATLRKLTGATFVDEKVIGELVKDIQRALLQADVNVQLVFSLTKSIKDRALGEKPPKGLGMREHVVNIVYDELVKFLGGDKTTVELTKKPFKLMLVGLFGNGKTTTCGKLAKHYKKRGVRVAMISTDTWRPAAFDQLKQLGAQIDIPVFGDKTLRYSRSSRRSSPATTSSSSTRLAATRSRTSSSQNSTLSTKRYAPTRRCS